MDTPEKTTEINSQLSKFEDSPVFNYISTLSPIKPVKSLHVSQTFHSLSFASLPSIFASPHVSSHKESRFLLRHNSEDLSKVEVASEVLKTVCSGTGLAMDASQPHDGSSQLQEDFDQSMSLETASVQSPRECSNSADEQSHSIINDIGSPNGDATRTCAARIDSMNEILQPLLLSEKETSQVDLLEGDLNLEELCQNEQKNEATESNWEDLIFDEADLLIFNSPMETQAFKKLTPKQHLGAEIVDSLNQEQSLQIVTFVGCDEQTEMEFPSTQPGETIELQDTNQMQENLAADNNTNKCSTVDSNVKVIDEVRSSIFSGCKATFNLHRGMRRRCLDFEMIGASRNNTIDNSSSDFSSLVQCNELIASDDEQLLPDKPATDPLRRILPGIGLHLNALAITCKNRKNVRLEPLSSTISLHSSASAFHSPSVSQELDKSLNLASNETLTENNLLAEDASQTLNEEPNQSSPKKKRRKMEGESETCKRCNCKKSKCLKLYCECFAAGVYCIEPCSCQDCFNKPIHEDTVLATRRQIESRNPLAFAPKVIRSSESVTEVGEDSSKTPASARHKRGCNCKKSNCLKKYCECFQEGVGCSIGCRCEGCKNTFGRKEGSSLMAADVEPEAYPEAEEKSGVGKAEVQNEEEQDMSSAIPRTPSPFCGTLVPMPFSSKAKPPRSLLGIGSSSGLHDSHQMYGKPDIIRSQSKFEKPFLTIPHDDMPDILCSNSSSGIKSLSPNSKRISPPQSNSGSSPGVRSGRKLILQSIPSFPSLTPQH